MILVAVLWVLVGGLVLAWVIQALLKALGWALLSTFTMPVAQRREPTVPWSWNPKDWTNPELWTSNPDGWRWRVTLGCYLVLVALVTFALLSR